MGNRPSWQHRVQLKQKAPAVAAVPVAAALPVDTPASAAAGVAPHAPLPAVKEERTEKASPIKPPPQQQQQQEEEEEQQQREPNEHGDDAPDNNQAEEEEAEEDAAEEDPLQFFRRLSSLSNGESDIERESQDLFMSYTQALLLKEAGDYAAASTLFRVVRNFKSLEVEAQYHLAQCLLLLDPELHCFGDEVVDCLERVCSATSAELLDAGAWDAMQRESTELLAHVLASQGHVQRARELLLALRGGNQCEAQESGARGFQAALCEFVLGDLEAAHAQLTHVDCRAALPLVQADVRAVERALGAATRAQQQQQQ